MDLHLRTTNLVNPFQGRHHPNHQIRHPIHRHLHHLLHLKTIGCRKWKLLLFFQKLARELSGRLKSLHSIPNDTKETIRKISTVPNIGYGFCTPQGKPSNQSENGEF